jgi:LuxR family maltose regulon positive regulatory protein
MLSLGPTSISQNLLLPHCDQIIQRNQAQGKLHHAINNNSLVFIHAPSGYGKTTLMREYVDSTDCHFQYLGFSTTVTPTEFWPIFFLSLKRLDYGLGEHLERLLPDMTSANFLNHIIQKLNKSSRSIHHADKLLIIFDNAHLFDQALLLQLNTLIDQLPDWLKFVMCANNTIDLQLADRQAHGHCQIFNQDLLKLDLENSWRLFQQSQSDQVSHSADHPLALELMQLCAGWPGAINILARDHYQLNQRFSLTIASNLYLFLQDSIMNPLDQDIHHFLSAICMLNAFSSNVLMTLLLDNNDNSYTPAIIQSLLSRSISAGLIEKSHDQMAIYEFAPVIKQFLQINYLLDPNNKSQYTAKKKLARDTFIDEQNFQQALLLSLELQDWLKGSNLILKLSQNFLQNGDMSQARDLLDRFPTMFIYSQPFLCLLKSLIFISSYEQQQAKLFMDSVDQHLNDLENANSEADKQALLIKMGLEDPTDIEVLINAHHILYGLMQRFTLSYDTTSTQRNNQLLSSNPLSSNHFLCWQYYGRAVDAFIQDDINTCIKQGNYALSLAKDIDDYSCMISSSGWLLHAMYYQGHVNQAIELAVQTLDYLTEKQALTMANIHNLYAALCFLHIEKNELDMAWHYYELIKSSIGAFTEPREILYTRYYLPLALFSASQMHSDIEGALIELDQYQNNLSEKASQAGIEDFSILFNTGLTRALFELKNKNAFPIMQWAMSEFDESEKDNSPCLFRFHYESFLHIAGKSFAGIDLSDDLENLIKHSQQQGVIARCISAYLFKARLHFNRDELELCEEQLKALLPMAKHGGFVGILIDDHNTQAMFEFAQAKNIEAQYVKQLLQAIKIREQYQPPHLHNDIVTDNVFIPAEDLFLTLTPREKEVLKQLSQGARNKELAETLNLSVATVKRHLQNIYAKLQVSSRTEAILLAQPLLTH